MNKLPFCRPLSLPPPLSLAALSHPLRGQSTCCCTATLSYKLAWLITVRLLLYCSSLLSLSFSLRLWPKNCHALSRCRKSLESYERAIHLIDSTWRHLLIKPERTTRRDTYSKLPSIYFVCLQPLEDYAAICIVSPNFYSELQLLLPPSPSSPSTGCIQGNRIVCLHSAHF